MKLVSPFLKHVVYPGLARSGYLSRHPNSRPVVVTYHGALPEGYRRIDAALDGALVTAASLRRQLLLLKNKYAVISPGEFLLWREGKRDLPARAVLLTCDDGLMNNLTAMLPIMREAGVQCLFFVTGASLGDRRAMLWYEALYLMLASHQALGTLNLPQRGIHFRFGAGGARVQWWELVRRLSRYDQETREKVLQEIRLQLGVAVSWDEKYKADTALGQRFRLLNSAELRDLAAAGMTVGAHTLSHPVLSQMPSDLAWKEVSESRSALEQALKLPVWALAYPFGDPSSVTQREFEMAERAGFACAFTNVEDGSPAGSTWFTYPRFHVTAETSLAEFEAHISGFHQSLRRRWMPAANASSSKKAARR